MVVSARVQAQHRKLLDINKLVAELSNMDVLVGVPRDKAARPGEPENNASLLYLHTHGSAMQRIPARPVIAPALNAPGNKEALVKRMGILSKAVLRGDRAAAFSHLKLLGIKARSIVYNWWDDPRNNWAPNAPSTIAAKIAKMTPGQMRTAIKRGGPLTKVLVDTNEMRKSISYVIRERKQ